MGYNLAVFAWRNDLDSAAKRKKAGVTFDAVYDGICKTGGHAALRAVDFAPFLRALAQALGKGDDAPYVVDRFERALVIRVAYADEPKLVPRIGLLARKAGLTSAGER